jgi:diguanylate cyclase
VSVNVSARQLQAGGFTETVATVLARWDLPGDALWLELTESLLIDDPSATTGDLDELRALGVKLSVDDFGTGYSSLAYLKRFPVDRVKIDAGFVRGVGDGGSDHSLIAAIVAMADALGLSTIAEGVETAEQADHLHALHVGAAQGYLFARPLPAAGVAGALERLGVVGAGSGVDVVVAAT